jgi:hypothetical protein
MESTEKQYLIHRILFPYEHNEMTTEELCHDIRTEIRHLLETSQKMILVMLARTLDIYLEKDDEMYYIAKLILKEVCGIKNPPLIKEWARYEIITRAAEKESDPDDWTTEMKEAYDASNWKRFSILRGYTEQEMNDFDKSIKLNDEVIDKYFDGNDDHLMGIMFEVQQGEYTYDDIINDRVDALL